MYSRKMFYGFCLKMVSKYYHRRTFNGRLYLDPQCRKWSKAGKSTYMNRSEETHSAQTHLLMLASTVVIV